MPSIPDILLGVAIIAGALGLAFWAGLSFRNFLAKHDWLG